MTAANASTLIEETVPIGFDFKSTVYSHGWVALAPFHWDPIRAELGRTQELSSGNLVRLFIQLRDNLPRPRLQIRVHAAGAISEEDHEEIRHGVRRMLRLDEDFGSFYALAERNRDHPVRIRPGAGRLLRCPTLFEDIVYTLCTTNISWSGTKRMVASLVTELGEPFGAAEEARAFPRAGAIVQAGVDTLQSRLRLGYRSGYIWELARQVDSGELDLDRLEDPGQPTEAVRQQLLALRGVGDYAAATILMLLGRYEHLAIDSEMRSFVSEHYFNSGPVADDQIQLLYQPWGKWKYLAYWFDLTDS